MAVTTTAFSSLVKKLSSDFPTLTFKPGEEFRWSPSEQTVWYVTKGDDSATLLHETSHGILKHCVYSSDIELLNLERAAWNKALELSVTYEVKISEDLIEDALDTYRDWLHARSLCPTCKQTGIQKKVGSYLCVVCNQQWHATEARHRGLQRRKTS